MPSLPSEAAATSSSPALNTPRFRLLGKLTQLVGESSSPASEQRTGPALAAEASSQVVKGINASSPGPQELAIGSSPAISAATVTLPVTVPASATVPEDRSIKIPTIRRTTYIFPDAYDRISLAHRNRYPSLKDIFQRNIEESPKLSSFTRYISYELRLCGPCLEDAVPSIVVFCPLKTLKKLKSLLTQYHIRSQFEPETNSPNSVRFGLYFWGQSVDMLALHEVTLVVPEKQDTNNALGDVKIGRAPWGVHITNSDGGRCTATMSCMIQVNGVLLGLTTAHAFRRPRATGSGAYDMDSDDSDTDDEYDTATERTRSDDGESAMTLHPNSQLNDTAEERGILLRKAQVHIPPLEDTSDWVQKHANLDWALVELGLEKAQMWRTTTADELRIAYHLPHLPKHDLDVLIMTRARPDVPATLYNIPSYMGGVKGSQAAQVWTVGCVPGNIDIRKGDSGSLVIDPQSGELYGMVMAANPFGDIHIAPLATILAQVKELFKTQDVSVLNLPPHLNSSMLGLGPEAMNPAKDQNSRSMSSPEPYIPLLEADYPTLDSRVVLAGAPRETDLQMLGRSPKGILERPLFSGTQEPASKQSADSKGESVDTMTSGPTFESLEEGTVDTQQHASSDGIESLPLTRANLESQGMPRLVYDMQAWVDGDLRAGFGALPSNRNIETTSLSDSSTRGLSSPFSSLPVCASRRAFRRDALAIGARFPGGPSASNGGDMELDEDWTPEAG